MGVQRESVQDSFSADFASSASFAVWGDFLDKWGPVRPQAASDALKRLFNLAPNLFVRFDGAPPFQRFA